MWRRIMILCVLLLALSAVSGVPVAAQSGVTWEGEYFNNAYLVGPSTFTRQDSAIAFDWGSGAPRSDMGTDNFSVRWGTDVFLQAGTYRFWALADDNVRVTINFGFNPLIDTFANPSVGRTVSGDITLPTGTHHIQVDYREVTQNAYVYVTWANLATNPGGPNFPAPNQPQPPTSLPGGQWTAQYFANRDLSGTPALIQTEGSPNRNWGSGAPASNIPADNFSVRWNSQQTLTSGTYRITTRSDDGVRVYVNGGLVIDAWTLASGQTHTADIYLLPGITTFVVEYFEAFGSAFIEFNLQLITTSGVPVTPPPVSSGGDWLVSYFNNRDLAGSPAAILSESSPNHNWGTGSPLPSIAADNFSARWTSTQTFDAGTYRITTRSDDGVRVYVDGQLQINAWQQATGQTYTRDLVLTAGSHTLVVEYFEAEGVAFIEFSIGPVTGGGNQGSAVQPPQTYNATATVTAYRLNVRDRPTTSSSAILTKINRGETYPIVGCSTNRDWWQINVNGTVGWVYANFVNTANTDRIPSTACSIDPGPADVSPTGYNVVAATNVNIRSTPSTAGAILGMLAEGQTAVVVGRNASATWWQINRSGTVGWVSGGFARIPGAVDLGRIPVTG